MQSRHTLVFMTCVALATLFAPLNAHADLILGNQPAMIGAGNVQIGPSGRQGAVGLTTPAGGPIVLGNVVLELAPRTTSAGDPVVTIQSDSSGNPSGTVLATLDIPTGFQTGGRALYTFNDPSAFEFQPLTTYWVVLQKVAGTAGNDNIFWFGHLNAPLPTSDLGVTFAGSLIKENGPWEPVSTSFVFHPNFTINTEPIPEPSSLALLGLGSLALVHRRKRMRHDG